MLITKRNKTVQLYDEQKVRESIRKAFDCTKVTLTDETLESILNRIELRDGMTTRHLQTQVEDILMDMKFFEPARYFLIWRHINHHSKVTADRVKFMREYLTSSNAATGSKFDPNANVTVSNLTTLSGELFKGDTIKLNRYRLYHKIEDMYGTELAEYYIWLIENHFLYKHDESSILPYCVSITMYPYLADGLKGLGGLSSTPKNIESYCGSFVNLMFAIASQFAGAIASGEFLMYFDYFARIEFGTDYRDRSLEFYKLGPELRGLIRNTNTPFKDFITVDQLSECEFESEELNSLRDKLVRDSTRRVSNEELDAWYKSCIDKDGNFVWSPLKLGDGSRTIQGQIEQYFQQVVYSMNQPAAARNFQSTFWNISYFDRYYFEGMFGDFLFPDGTKPEYESLKWLQKKFMKWFYNERKRTLLTFPVETVSMLTKDGDIRDEEMADLVAQMNSVGHTPFIYLSDNPDALSSCCRLRSEVTDNQFSYSLGAGGVATGSKSVMTINLNRFIQQCIKDDKNYIDELRELVKKLHKFQTAFNELLKEYYELGAMPVYNAGFIDMKKQYLTIGINGMVEAAEFMGLKARVSDEYNEFVDSILKVLYEENKAARTKELMFNTEFVPAENLGVKNYKWDKRDGYWVPKDRECYNSYFYASEDQTLSIIDKFKLHGEKFVKYLDGGSALHMNLDELPSKEQARQLLRIAAKEGTNYYTYNIPMTCCKDCGTNHYTPMDACPKCGSHNVVPASRVIGYLKMVENYSEDRQKEYKKRYFANPKNQTVND